jgi:hypothetical protein
MEEAEKILDRLRRSQNNCTRHDLEVIYEANGFEIRKGKKHDFAIHTKYIYLRGTLPNHKSFAKGYVTDAIKFIDETHRLQKQEETRNEQKNRGEGKDVR